MAKGIKAPHDLYATAFCASCRSIVSFQARDVLTVQMTSPHQSTVPRATCAIECECGELIEIGRPFL